MEIQQRETDRLCETSSWRLLCCEACCLGLVTTRVLRAVTEPPLHFQQSVGHPQCEQQRINKRVLPPSAVDTILENETRTIVLLALTENRESLLMWAHYAASHTGFLIGFEPRRESCRRIVPSPHRQGAVRDGASE